MHDTHGAYKISLSPYPGLRAFRKDESDVFFGRDEHVDLLIKKLANAHFVCVTGPSGCGKSSLVRTGLQNALEAGFLAGRGSDWIFCDFFPADQPLEEMTRALAKACAEYVPASGDADESANPADEVHNMLMHGIKDARHSNDLSRILAPVDLGGRPILLFVDQFEELFRYAQREPAAAVRFVEILLQTAAAKSNIYVVITIRTDELEKCARYAGLTRVINESQFLTPTLDRYQIQEAIEGPIAIFGGKIDPKLTIWLLNSLDEELDKLPLMQHALKLLYAHKSGGESRPDVHLTIEDFAAVFDPSSKFDFSRSESRFALRETLESRLEAIYHGLPNDHLKRVTARLFCALTAIDSGSRDIRRPLPLATLALTIGASEDETRFIVNAFRSRDENYLIVKGGEDGVVDVPHECILRLWPRLRTKWLGNERESADKVLDLARRAKDWDIGAKQVSLLKRAFAPDVLKGQALRNYRLWFETSRPNRHWAARYLIGFRWRVGPRGEQRPLTTDEIYGTIERLMEASNAYRRQFHWTLGIGSALALAGVVAIAGLQLKASDIARQKAYLSIAKKVTESKAGPYPVANLAVAVDAMREAKGLGDPGASVLAAGNLWEVLAGVRELSRASNRAGPDAELFGAHFADDGRAIVTLDRWGRIADWPFASHRLGSPRAIDAARAPKSEGRSLAVSPLGDVAAAGYNNGALRLFDLKAAKPGAHELRLVGGNPHASFILKLAFSADGKQLFTSSHDGTIWAWSRVKPDGTLAGASETSSWTPRLLVDTRRLGPAPIAAADHSKIWSLDVNRETTAIAFGLGSGRVCMLGLKAGARPNCSAAGHGKTVKAVKFQPGRNMLVSAGNDDRVAYWRWSANFTLVPTATRIFEESDIWDMDFSSDGRLLATASWDGMVRIYDADDRRLLLSLPGHEQLLRSIRFDPTSRLLATSSFDGTARIMTPFESRASVLDLSYRFPMAAAENQKQAIEAVALGADGTWIAFHDRKNVHVKTTDKDQPVRLGPSSGPQLIAHVVAHPAAPIIVASLARPSVVIWTRQASGSWTERSLALPGDRREPRPIAISPDGRTLAVAISDAGTASVLLCPLPETGNAWTCSGGGVRSLVVSHAERADKAILPTALAFSSRGQLAVGASDGSVRLFDPGTATEPVAVYAGQKDAITSVAFAPDGKSLLSTSRDKSLRLWTIADGSHRELKGHKSFVEGTAFSAGGRWAASTSQDETVMIWNAEDGKPIARLPIERDSILSFDTRKTPRGTLMATGSDSGTVNVMHFFETPDELLAHAETFLRENIGYAARAE